MENSEILYKGDSHLEKSLTLTYMEETMKHIILTDNGETLTIRDYPGSIRNLAELIKQLHPDHEVEVGYFDEDLNTYYI